MAFGPNQTFVGFADSFSRYAVAASGNPTMDAQIDANWTVRSGALTISAGGPRGNNCLNVPFGAFLSKTFSHQNRWILTFKFNLGSGGVDGPIFSLLNNGTTLFQLRRNVDGTCTLLAGTTGVIASSTFSMSLRTWYTIEIDAAFSGSSNIACAATLRIAKVIRATGSANSGVNVNSLVSGSATANVLTLQPGTNTAGGGSFCDLAWHNNGGSVLTGFLGDVRITGIYPNGDVVSNFTTSSGSTHNSLVNEHQADFDSTYVEDATPTDKDIWDWDDIPSFSGTIKFIYYTTCARKTDEGGRSYKLNVGDTGTESQSEEFFPSENYLYEGGAIEADPATGLAWTQAGFNAKRFGVEIES